MSNFQWSPAYLLGIVAFLCGLILTVYAAGYQTTDVGVIIKGILFYSGLACIGLSVVLTLVIHFILKKLNSRT